MDSKVVKEIFVLIRQNRKDGVEKLYLTYYAQLYAIAFSIIKDHHKSQDIVHNIILRLLEMDDALLPQDGELVWLATIIKNATFNEIKNGKKINYREELSNLEEKSIEETVDLEEFNKMIKDLDDERKQVLSLKILGDYSFKEIALILSIKPRKARYLYNTAVKNIKNTIIALGTIALSFFVLFVFNVIFAVLEVVPVVGAGQSFLTTINGIVIGQVGYENFDVTWVEYTGYMFLLFTAIVTFFYHNANEVGTKAKRKKKDEKKN